MGVCLEETVLNEAAPIHVRYFLGRAPRAEGWNILVVKYEGVCRSGAVGEPDGRFMLAMRKAGLTTWEPDGLVVDLTDLDCKEFSEGLTSLLYLGEGYYGSENLPEAVVVGPRCESAIRWYYQNINAHCRPETTKEYFHDVETAIEQVEEETNG